MELNQSMGNIVKNHHRKFELNSTRNDVALRFFQSQKSKFFQQQQQQQD